MTRFKVDPKTKLQDCEINHCDQAKTNAIKSKPNINLSKK